MYPNGTLHITLAGYSAIKCIRGRSVGSPSTLQATVTGMQDDGPGLLLLLQPTSLFFSRGCNKRPRKGTLRRACNACPNESELAKMQINVNFKQIDWRSQGPMAMART